VSKFSIDVAKFARKTSSTMGEAARAIKISLFNGVIRDTRVDTGRLRGNWQTSTGRPILTQIERLDRIPQGADGGESQTQVIATVTPDGVDYMTNNLPYAEVWEERDGMIAKNMARIQRNVNKAVKDVR
jgi:hypothetical protein